MPGLEDAEELWRKSLGLAVLSAIAGIDVTIKMKRIEKEKADIIFGAVVVMIPPVFTRSLLKDFCRPPGGMDSHPKYRAAEWIIKSASPAAFQLAGDHRR